MASSLFILDNFLPKDDFSALATYLRRLKYAFRTNFTYDEAMNINVGLPVYADPYFSDSPDGQTQYNSYPTATPVDHFFERLKMLTNLDDGLPILRGKSSLFEAEPLLLPTGAAAGLVAFEGVQFEYYFHSNWGADWGGELLLDPLTEDGSAPGCGRYIAPKSNRLVVIGAGLSGSIRRVGPRASHTARCTLRGKEIR